MSVFLSHSMFEVIVNNALASIRLNNGSVRIANNENYLVITDSP